MAALVFLLLCLGAAIALALWRAPLWGGGFGSVGPSLRAGFASAHGGLPQKLLGWIPAIGLGVLLRRIRRQGGPCRRSVVKRISPPCATEREALTALSVSMRLFAARNWDRLRAGGR